MAFYEGPISVTLALALTVLILASSSDAAKPDNKLRKLRGLQDSNDAGMEDIEFWTNFFRNADMSMPETKCDVGESCREEGSTCSVGTETCCGEIFDSFVCECANIDNELKYQCFFTDACLRPPCETISPTLGVIPSPTPPPFIIPTFPPISPPTSPRTLSPTSPPTSPPASAPRTVTPTADTPNPITPFPTVETTTQNPITPFPTVDASTQSPITPFPTVDNTGGTPATPNPTDPRTPVTPNPTDPRSPDTLSPTPLATSEFICPSADFVGCTAPDPNNPLNECDPVGEPCVGGNPGEFCCQDGCPRNYCTAKPGLPPVSP
mmetsp:Transcript_8914/g.18983  ORF Transcript_8914/g.18983 Transcript_8914/m.18983 type:complete len:322 (+) Transcript_8914:219-1184(+)